MTTITIELADDLARELEQQAAQSGVSLSEIAAQSLKHALRGGMSAYSGKTPGQHLVVAADAEVAAVAKRVIVEDAELLRRLAE